MRATPEPPKPATRPERKAKADRLAAALRANLARRKAQKRARDDRGDGPGEQGPGAEPDGPGQNGSGQE